MSPVHSTTVRYGKPEQLQHALGIRASALSSSSYDVSGVVNFTSSTLSNWCWRISPRTSAPYEPASLRKHGVYAV